MLDILIITAKILFASLIVGVGLSFFDVTAIEVLAKAGMTPARIAELIMQGFQWALPNIILGSMVIVPVWLLTFMLRPPRG